MQGKSMGLIKGVSRRHLVAGAVAALALPIATRAAARGIEMPATEADTGFMRMAIAEAAVGDYPFGTVIVRDGEVLARGRNLGKQEKDPREPFLARVEKVAHQILLNSNAAREQITKEHLGKSRLIVEDADRVCLIEPDD